jgi:hypothetical protein
MSIHSIFSSDSSRGFDVSVQLSNLDPRLRPGLTAQIVFQGSRKTGVLYLPRQALFMKDGKRIVYVKDGSSYRQHEVKIQSESESRAAIDGLEEGTQVALIDPTTARKMSSAGSAAGGTEGAP